MTEMLPWIQRQLIPPEFQGTPQRHGPDGTAVCGALKWWMGRGSQIASKHRYNFQVLTTLTVSSMLACLISHLIKMGLDASHHQSRGLQWVWQQVRAAA